ncbi:hypothetical protein [Burkholderia pseudomallei]|uniref:hypothetical protein n=1 Tax=Burkholderia pseudomallei TaxID=28450 RepID=UPI0005373610|nr:hypothetical protein [Burkholderia pseudomallei]KGW45341.1 hypothetical protein Y049_4840 [Burkholderia pseudomallei MSHR684]
MSDTGQDDKETSDLKYALQVWGKTIDVQMHFNELQMKIRNFSVLLVSALVGAAGIALKEHVLVDHFFMGMHVQTSLSAILFWVAAFSWAAFFFMDHFWYYRLLGGSVRHGMSIEKLLADRIPSIGLTKTIGDASPNFVFKWKLHSKHKSFIFYAAIFLLLVGLAGATGWAGVTQSEAKPAARDDSAKVEMPINAPMTMEAHQTNGASPPPTGTTIIFNQELNNGQSESSRPGGHGTVVHLTKAPKREANCASSPVAP